ncbi:MAG: prephenate dehydratase [Flavobacteriaceae bacterium]
MKVAIQGIRGSFHHIVADDYFQDQIDLVECMSFAAIPELICNGEVSYGVMAIENSIAGAILPNYALIDEHNLAIAGEYYLNVQHNLLALKGQDIMDIKEVHSHPMALLQCRSFFKAYPHIKLVEDTDTADVAKRIQEKQLKGIAAIASELAAQEYGLEVLAPAIQTVKENQTRFVIVEARESKYNSLPNKASIKFGLEHRKGGLGEVLLEIAENNVSLTKIQSLPVIENPWEYEFFADLIFDNYHDFKNALIGIKPKVSGYKILGEYIQNK